MYILYECFKRSLPLGLGAYLNIVCIQFWMIYRPFSGIEMHSFQTFMYLSSCLTIAIFKDSSKLGFFISVEKKIFDLFEYLSSSQLNKQNILFIKSLQNLRNIVMSFAFDNTLVRFYAYFKYDDSMKYDSIKVLSCA